MRIIVKKETDVAPADLSSEKDLKGVDLLPSITDKDGAPHFSMRLFRLAPEGYTPFHTHSWEHEVFVVGGAGEVVCEEENVPLGPGMAVFVPGGERHRFRAGDEGMVFLCCVPNT